MTASIPASQLVQVTPSVLGAGGNPLSLNAVFLTQDTSIPIGTVQPFSTAQDVSDWFGPNSDEAHYAAIYFAGYERATTLPGTLYFVQYAASNVAGYVRGGSVAAMALATLQGFSGTLTVTVDGTPHTTASINLSGATSFSNAAALIDAALVTASAGATCTYDPLRAAFVITSNTTGAASSVSYGSGTFATDILLTAATGAVRSAGANATTPAAAMAAIVAVTQNWATFMTVWEPTLTVKEAFAAWVTTTTDRYMYVAWDSDTAALVANATGSFGYLTRTYNGVCAVWNPSGDIAAFICGTTASIDFARVNGRITFAFKSQAGLTPDVTDATIANNLIGNGYNFYGAYATANQAFQFLQPGQISGAWDWIDEYVNQISLNNAFQLAFMELLANTNSIPYNAQGYGLIRSAALDPINAALNFGSIRAGVTLSNAQQAEVNTAAGAIISPTLQQVGWFLQILDAAPLTRAGRGSPPMTFWYMSGGSIQKLDLASIDIL